MPGKPNYAFKPIAELALRSNQTIVPQRLNAALAFTCRTRSAFMDEKEGVERLCHAGAIIESDGVSAERRNISM